MYIINLINIYGTFYSIVTQKIIFAFHKSYFLYISYALIFTEL